MAERADLLDYTADIVAAFVTKNAVQASELPHLIRSVHAALPAHGQTDEALAAEPKPPAVSIKKSVSADYLICLEDGLKFKSMKQHLASKYGMTPDEYRAKWTLPKDYPMVAPAYSAQRADFARKMGLGAGGRVAKSGQKPGRMKVDKQR